MTDSRGEVRWYSFCLIWNLADSIQVAYLMADISNVNIHEIKALYESLEGLKCTWIAQTLNWPFSNFSSSHYDSRAVLGC